jgi:hypothetical protein
MKRLTQTAGVSLCVVIAVGLLTPIRERSAAHAARADDDVALLVAQQPLGPLFGKQVLIVGGGVPEDGKRGTLEAADSAWIRIRNRDGQVYCYSAANLQFVAPAGEAKP